MNHPCPLLDVVTDGLAAFPMFWCSQQGPFMALVAPDWTSAPDPYSHSQAFGEGTSASRGPTKMCEGDLP